LGICSWWYYPTSSEFVGTSFFGNASSYALVEDLPAGSYLSPYITFAGGGGSDVLGFNGAGLYLVHFQFITYSSSTNSVDVGAVSTLSNVNFVNGSKNTTDIVDDSFGSFDLFYALDGGYITLPNHTSLLTLYGATWAAAFCGSLSIIRLS